MSAATTVTRLPQLWSAVPVDDRFCEACGAGSSIVPRATSAGDRREIDAGRVAGVERPRARPRRNEDAFCVDAGDGLVGRGGVRRRVVGRGAADRVAARAADAAGDVLAARDDRCRRPGAMRAAVAAAARRGRCGCRGTPRAPRAPSCTFVAAVWDGTSVTVGSVGDSRAYWIDHDGTCC